MKKQYLAYVLTALLLSSGAAFAQEPQVLPPTDQDTQPQPALGDAADVEEVQVEVADDNETEEDEDSPSRFIPTEQISQDLGVSFPADI